MLGVWCQHKLRICSDCYFSFARERLLVHTRRRGMKSYLDIINCTHLNVHAYRSFDQSGACMHAWTPYISLISLLVCPLSFSRSVDQSIVHAAVSEYMFICACACSSNGATHCFPSLPTYQPHTRVYAYTCTLYTTYTGTHYCTWTYVMGKRPFLDRSALWPMYQSLNSPVMTRRSPFLKDSSSPSCPLKSYFVCVHVSARARVWVR